MKKDMIFLAYENHYKWPNVSLVQYFCRGFDYANAGIIVLMTASSSFFGFLIAIYVNNILNFFSGS